MVPAIVLRNVVTRKGRAAEVDIPVGDAIIAGVTRWRVDRPGALVIGALSLLLRPSTAAADGAFPDSMQILLPPDRPQEIILSTNFGLLVSHDGGKSWSFVCEESIADPGEMIAQYQLGPGPTPVLYAPSGDRVLSSADDACSWSAAEGSWTGMTDLFADPTAAGHLFGLALVPGPGGELTSALLESQDAARSFVPIFQASAGVLLTGVENAASAPRTIYLSETIRAPGGGVQPRLARSEDGGKTFVETDALASLGPREPRIAAVDPTDPRTIYYRVVDVAGDRLAISRDGGQTAAVVLQLPEAMTAFLRRGDGTLLVATIGHGGWQSRDGGKTFAPWPQAPRLRALGERAGVLYGVGDNFQDRFAVGWSSDGGQTWTPLLRFDEICQVASCSERVAQACQGPLIRLMALVGGSCQTPLPEAPRDASVDATISAPKAGGCACAAAPGSGPGGWSLLVGLAVVNRLFVRARRKRQSM
jgi:MYXO-CTERM domain-containing protein